MQPQSAEAWPWTNPCKQVKSEMKIQDKIHLELYKSAKTSAEELLKSYTNSNFLTFKNQTVTALQEDIKIYNKVTLNPKCFSADKSAASLTIINQNKNSIKALNTYDSIDGFPKESVIKVSKLKIESIYNYLYIQK